MRELGTVLGGIGLLIFAYLALTHAQSLTTVAEGIAKSSTTVIATLQGNAGTASFNA